MKKFYEMLSRHQVTFLAALESGRLSSLPLNIIARHALSMRLETLRHGTRHALFHEARAVALAVVPCREPQATTVTPVVSTTFLRFKVFGTKYLFVLRFWVILRV
jgi:hypothetical protein